MRNTNMMNRKDLRLAALLLLGLPFVFSYQTMDPVLMPRFVLLGAALLVSIGLLWYRTVKDSVALRLDLRNWPVLLCLGIYLVTVAVSLVQAHNMAEAAFDLSRSSLIALLVVVLCMMIIVERGFLDLLIKGSVAVVIALSVLGLLEYFTALGEIIPGASGQPTGLMGHRNLFASFLAFNIPLCVIAALHYRRRWFWLGTVAVLGGGSCIVIVGSRSVWLAVAASVIAVAALRFARPGLALWHDAEYGRRLKTALLVVAPVLVVLFFLPLRSGPYSTGVERAGSLADAKEKSIGERTHLYMKTLEMIGDHPLLGVGAGNWQIEFPKYGLEHVSSEMEAGTTTVQRPHNDYLWVFADTGIFGLLAYASIFIVTVATGLRALPKVGPHLQLILLMALAGMAIYCVDALFSFSRERIEHSVIAAVFIAIVAVIHAGTREPGGSGRNGAVGEKAQWAKRREIRRTDFPRPVAPAVPSPPSDVQLRGNNPPQNGGRGVNLLHPGVVIPMMTVLVASIYIGVVRYSAETHVRNALEARQSRQWQVMIDEIERGYHPLATVDPSTTPLKFYSGVAHYAMGNTARAAADFAAAAEANPNHLHTLNNLASCRFVLGELDSAKMYYQQALQISPRFSDALVNLGAVYYRQGDLSTARTLWLRCIEYSNDPRAQRYLDSAKINPEGVR